MPKALFSRLDGGEREGQHILGDDGAAADEGVLAHDAVLVDGAECAQRDVVLNDDVAGESRGVGQDAMAAYLAVVADMRAGHEQVVRSRGA